MVSPLANISSLSPDEVVVPPPPSLAGDFKQFKDLAKRVAESLQISPEEI